MTFTRKFFDPEAAGGVQIDDDGTVKFVAGPRPQDTYLYKPRIVLAINVALATQRPLLISGEPGSGKTVLAQNVAAVLGWWSYKQTVTSRSTASDLLWTFDVLGRLNDANTKGQTLHDKQHYVEPGGLWWAFDPVSATERGESALVDPSRRAVDPGTEPGTLPTRDRHDDKAVILLDEIDKADPDVPNDLLEPLDSKQFTVKETNHTIRSRRDVLLMMTTNGERELPPAFMRRCVAITLDPPTKEWFVHIADQKFGAIRDGLHDAIADEVMSHRRAAARRGLREPSTAEYLDALQVCRELEVDTGSDAWTDVAMDVLWKHDASPNLAGEPATNENAEM